jgi:hypothetical protein
MNRAHGFVVAVILLSAQTAFAQDAKDLSRYRDYVLESSVDTVVAVGGQRATEVKTLHERPAKIQQLEWRASYVNPATTSADPVRNVAFAFYNDALYQVVVTYSRDRTEGLTNSDIIESLSASYGAPVLKSAIARTDLPADVLLETTVLAQWNNASSSITLLRDTYSPEFQLILSSKPLIARARTAIREAIRLDALDAPRREAEKVKQDAADTDAARDKTRSTNKTAFRP